MDQAITRAAGAAPRAVGEFQGYVDGVDGIKPSVRWLDRKNMPQIGDRLFAIPGRAAVPRSWSILLTSENHGTVGPVGCTFPWAGEKHERVQVVEIVEAGAPPAPGTDLGGLVRIDEQAAIAARDDDLLEVVRCLCSIAGRRAELAPEKRAHYPHVDEEGSPTLMAARAACLARGYTQDGLAVEGVSYPVAAQAGQVAVPEGWMLVPIEPTEAMMDRAEECDHEFHRASWSRIWPAMLAAAPAAPAQAKPLPADWISVGERLPDSGYCLATYRNRHGKLRIIRAKYARQFEIDAGEDAIDQGNCEYNEADDTFYLKAGWLECIDNWDDYSSIYVTEGEVTHWMPLPAAPSPAKESK